jgi:hypothetical protein
MPRRRRIVALITAVVVLALAPAADARIPLELRFDGQPIDPTAPPDFSCFDQTRGSWARCILFEREEAAAPR